MPEVLRESQARILSYTCGKMGISAVRAAVKPGCFHVSR